MASPSPSPTSGSKDSVPNRPHLSRSNAFRDPNNSAPSTLSSSNTSLPMPSPRSSVVAGKLGLNASDSNDQRWQFKASEIVLSEMLGKGSFGEVYKGVLRGQVVAVKKLIEAGVNTEAGLDEFLKEASVMAKLRHPNLLLFMGVCTEEGHFSMITEYITGGSVYDKLRSSEELTFDIKMRIAQEAALGMNWLHCEGFIHRDLKTGNMLLDGSNHVKICDFGFAHVKTHQPGVLGAYGNVGTPLWMAPEVLLNKPYNEKADVYSFGIVLWELLTREEPFANQVNSFEDLMAVVERNERPPIPPTCPDRLRKLIVRCWNVEPSERPSFQHMIDEKTFSLLSIEGLLSDPVAAAFWEKYFLGESNVPGDTLMDKISDYFKKPYTWRDHLHYRCLRALLPDKPSLGLDQDKSLPIINITRFAALVEWFGPIKDFDKFTLRIHDLMREKYFHGDMTSSQAESLLKVSKQLPGTFIVRFSARDPGLYAISALEGDGKVKHYRVFHKCGQGFRLGSLEKPSLQDVLVGAGKQLHFEIPCEGSPFQVIWDTSSGFASNYVEHNLIVDQ